MRPKVDLRVRAKPLRHLDSLSFTARDYIAYILGCEITPNPIDIII